MANLKKKDLKNINFNSWCEQQNKKKKALLGSRIFLVAVFWGLILAYLISPFSKATIVEYQGNYEVVNKDDIYNLGDFDENSFWWSVDLNKTKEKISSYANSKYILDLELIYTFTGIKVHIEENVITAKYIEDGNTVYLLRDGTSFIDDGNLENSSDGYFHLKHLNKSGKILELNKEGISNDMLSLLLEQLATSSARHFINDVKINNIIDSSNNITNYEITFLKDRIHKDKDLKLVVRAEEISNVLSSSNFQRILNFVCGNEEFLYNECYYAIYGPTPGNTGEYGFIPFEN